MFSKIGINYLLASLLISLMSLVSCANLRKVDKSILNHKSMNLSESRTHPINARGQVLNAGGLVGSQTACVSCAK